MVLLGSASLASAATLTVGSNLENYDLSNTVGTLLNLTGNTLNTLNTLTGNDANDLINGSAGTDTMLGGKGNDTFTVDNVGDVVLENPGEGIDLVNTPVSYTLATEVDNQTLTGSLVINGTGNAIANLITGNSAANQLVGLAGDDTLNGAAGADTLAGGPGNDAYVVDNAGDLIVENPGEGTDTVSSSVTYTLSANVDHLVLTGASAINGTGNADANTLSGNVAANTLDGGVGADLMNGGLGKDTYVVDDGGDSVVEAVGAGTDLVRTTLPSHPLTDHVENLAFDGVGNFTGTGKFDPRPQEDSDGNSAGTFFGLPRRSAATTTGSKCLVR